MTTLLTDPSFLSMLLVGAVILGLALFFSPLYIWHYTSQTAKAVREQTQYLKRIVQLIEAAPIWQRPPTEAQKERH